jgi:hypothetical protein
MKKTRSPVVGMGKVRPMKWVLWSVGAGVVALGLVVSCSDSNGGLGPGKDSGGPDGRSPDGRSPVDSAALDSGALDAGSTDTGSGDGDANVATGCYTVRGSGSAKICEFASSRPEAGCSRIDAGFKAGSCPPADLLGCCVYAPPSDGGDAGDGGAFKAICYYGADAETTGHNECTMEDFNMGPGYKWYYELP